MSREIKRLRAENESLRIQLQQQWEIIYKYEKKEIERHTRKKHQHRSIPGNKSVDSLDARIRELETDNHILAKYLLNNSK
jgi:predicted RNase H-like nuclease (RuvC/YqgF family)